MYISQRVASFALFFCAALLLLTSSLGHAQCTGSGPYTCTETQSVSIPAGPPNTGFGTWVPATVYPSQLTISGLSGTIATISVQLHGLTSNGSPTGGCGTADLGVLLEAPNGSYMELMGQAGNCNNGELWTGSGVLLNIQDAPPNGTGIQMPTAACGGSQTATWPNLDVSNGSSEGGPFAPTSCPFSPGFDIYPSGPVLTSATAAPPAGTATLTNTFATEGLSPNGTWKLYLVNDEGANSIEDAQSISGWSLIFTLNSAATSTTTTLSSNINPSFTSGANSSVTLTASVTASSGTPTGTVAFKDGANTITGCGAQTLSGGQTTCNSTFTTQGNHALTADYSGGGGFVASDSATLNQFVETPTTGSFCNTGSITIPAQDNTSPYPSVINVTGISNAVATVSLTLNGFSWGQTADAVHLLLVSPNSQALEFFSAGDGATTGTYTFIDTGAQAPQTGITPNSYQPTVYTIGDVFTPQPPLPAPQVPSSFNVAAPAGGSSAGTFESSFNGATASGAWSLFVYDAGGVDATGSITGGWCLDITQATGTATTTTLSATPNPALTGAAVTVTATVKSGGSPINAVGVVTFTENGQNVAGGPTSPVAVDSNGHASFSTSSLPEGDHDILGTYTDTTGTYALSFGSRYVRVDNPTTVTSNNGVTSYCNPGTITIPGPLNPIDDGPASPNPSNVFVANAPGTINHVTVTLNGVQLSTPYFLTSLLVGPSGTSADSLDFFSDVGGSTPMTSPVNVTLDDNASSLLGTGASGSPLVTGSFKPTSGKGSDTFVGSSSGFYTPPLGPYQYAAPIGSFTFGGLYDNQNPNGTWSLYLYQDTQATNSSMSSWCVNLTENPPVLAITKSHVGDFSQGQTGAQYTVNITNNGPGATGGTVTVTENPPSGLTVTGMSGNNWSCSGSSCTRTDSLAQGGTYDSITVTVSVSNTAPATVTNSVSVSGGGTASTATATDLTTITPAPALSVTKTHVGSGFTGGQTGEWDIAVGNTTVGSTTSNTLTVTDPLPSGFTLSSFTGTGWNCVGSTTVTCTSTQAVSGGSSFPTIALIVNVPAVTSPTTVSNTATASGGGSFASASGSDNNVPVNPGTYQLTTAVAPTAGGTVSPPSGPQTAGSSVALLATPAAGYAFVKWTSSPDSVANPTSPSTTITMNAAESVTANFALNTVNVTVATSPTGLAFSVDGTNYTSTQTFTWTIGSGHTIATTSPQTPVAGTQYTFANWSDGGSLSHSVIASATTTSYTATFNTAYLLTTAANPTNGGTVTPSSGTYYAANSVVNLTATPNANYVFSSWTGNVANANNASTTVTMNAPQSVTANFVVASVTVSPNSIAFGNVIVGRPAKKVVTVENNTPQTIRMGPITLTVTLGDSSQFRLDHVCPATLKAGKSCVIGVSFIPDAIGSAAATLNIVTSASGSPIEVPITGAGIAKK